MCRLFGFHSILNSSVHSSLVEAENALFNLGSFHPDGWGIAYYIDTIPHLYKSKESALKDDLFKKISGLINSKTVLAHIRKATHGRKAVENSHPFQFGRWTFAHNGNIRNFNKIKNTLIKNYLSDFDRYKIIGDTDSEFLFHYLIQDFILVENKKDLSLEYKIELIKERIKDLIHLIGPLKIHNDPVPGDENYLTFILTDGSTFIGFNGGIELYYCTHKSVCPQKNNCDFFDSSCETKSKTDDKVNHLILTSEKIKGKNIWYKLRAGEIIGVDKNYTLKKAKLDLDLIK